MKSSTNRVTFTPRRRSSAWTPSGVNAGRSDAARDNLGAFQLASGCNPRLVIDPNELHRNVIDQEAEPSHDDVLTLFEAETLGYFQWSWDGGDLKDVLVRRVALVLHLGAESWPPFPLVAVVVLGGQRNRDRWWCSYERSLPLSGLDQP